MLPPPDKRLDASILAHSSPLRKAVLLPLPGHCHPGDDHGGIKENNEPIHAPDDLPRLWYHPSPVSAGDIPQTSFRLELISVPGTRTVCRSLFVVCYGISRLSFAFGSPSEAWLLLGIIGSEVYADQQMRMHSLLNSTRYHT